MKKTLFALLFTFASASLFAQDASQIRLGLTAHPNFGFLKVENGKGTILNYMPYHALSSSTASADYDVKFKMQYLEIPLTIKLKTDETNNMKWFGQFGLSTNFRIGAKQNVEKGTTPLADDVKVTDLTKFFRAGMVIGGGMEYRLGGKTSLLTGLTYNNGLTNISKNDHSVKNHYVALNVGIFFKFGI